MRPIRPDMKCLAARLIGRDDQLHRHEVAVGNGRGVEDGKRVFGDGFDGPPYVDDLVPASEKGGGFDGEEQVHAAGDDRVGLVDVHEADGRAGRDGCDFVGCGVAF